MTAHYPDQPDPLATLKADPAARKSPVAQHLDALAKDASAGAEEGIVHLSRLAEPIRERTRRFS